MAQILKIKLCSRNRYHIMKKRCLITVSVLAGCGAALLLMAGIVVINQEFTERRTTAMGISSTGGSIGAIVLPPLTSWWIDIYNWRDAFILLSGLCLQGVVAGVLLKACQRKAIYQNHKTGMACTR